VLLKDKFLISNLKAIEVQESKQNQQVLFYKVFFSKSDNLMINEYNHRIYNGVKPFLTTHKIQGSRCQSPMSQFAIFFLVWRLKSASGDFFGAYISLCKFIDN
jgi:hypothetical protein